MLKVYVAQVEQFTYSNPMESYTDVKVFAYRSFAELWCKEMIAEIAAEYPEGEFHEYPWRKVADEEGYRAAWNVSEQSIDGPGMHFDVTNDDLEERGYALVSDDRLSDIEFRLNRAMLSNDGVHDYYRLNLEYILEDECVERLAIDKDGIVIHKDDYVIWTDPETGMQAKYQVWDYPNEEMVKLWSEDGECEALPGECEVI